MWHRVAIIILAAHTCGAVNALAGEAADIRSARGQAQELERQQRDLLEKMHRRIDAMPDGPRRDEYRARLAEIEKRINNPEQRLYVDGFAKFTPEMRAYYDKMINRLEDCGTRNFPKKGSKSVYGKGVVSFTLDEAGIASHLEIVKPSRNPSADAHIFRVIRSTSPFGPIPKRPTIDSDHDYDKLVMITSFNFEHSQTPATTVGEDERCKWQ